MKTGFDKEVFKKSVIYNVKSQFRKTLEEATPEQVYQAVCYAVKDVIIDEWIATHKEYEKQDSKTLYYLSMEFLMGRALGNNIINIMARDEIKEALDEMGFDLNLIEDQEPDGLLETEVWAVLLPASLIPGYAGLSGIWMWNPLSVWHVQAEDCRWLSGRGSG